jgi:hypothetical protein
MTSFLRDTQIAVFEKKATPTMFLSGRFQTPERNIFSTIKVNMDIKRSGEEIAIDVLRGAGGRLNFRKQLTNKEYTPPFYNEYANVNENEQLLNRIAGMTEYDDVTAADIIDMITDDQILLSDKIDRAKEYQAAQAFFNSAQITLINGDTIDFKQKATHRLSPAIDWSNASGDPDADLQTQCDVNRKDGFGTSTDAIFGATAWQLYKDNTKVKEKTNFRRVDEINVRPPLMNAEGANFHGTITVGDYKLNVWTYPQFYMVPTGFGLPNEGEKVPYVPTSKVWVGNFQVRFDLLYAGIANLMPLDPRLSTIGFSRVPMITRGKVHLYGAVDELSQNAIYGVKSAPLCVPTDIDSYSVLTVA